MASVKYSVKVRDNAGHEFVRTYGHWTAPDQLTSNNTPLSHQLMQTYRSDILRSAPFRCVNCGSEAQQLFNFPVAYLAEDDPVVFDCGFPFCRSLACEKAVHDKIQAKACNVGKGAGLTRNKGHPSFQRQQDEDHPEVTACVTCGDSKNLRKCKGCKLVRYCSPSCQ